MLVLAPALFGGCAATTIEPPAAPEDPVSVFLLDHGRHATLVLPHPEGIVRYAYGDWAWYAEVKTGPLRAVAALLFPSRGALGRRVMDGPATEAAVRGEVRVGIEHLHRFTVEKRRMEALRSELETLFAAGRAVRLENRGYDLTFVPHPESYWAFRNSNQKVAQWLERLGCRIRGSALWSDWRIGGMVADR